MNVAPFTWLPLANVTESFRCLHDEDLVAQIRDARQVLRDAAENPDSRLLSVRMWRGYEGGLLAYLGRACLEYEQRIGHTDHTRSVVQETWGLRELCDWPMTPLMPRWFGYRAVHLSHKSQLIAWRPTHYAQQWPEVPLGLPRLVPVNVPGRFEFTVVVVKPDGSELPFKRTMQTYRRFNVNTDKVEGPVS